MNPREQKQLDVPSFAAHSTRGLIRDRRTRRMIMLIVIAAAAVLALCGANIDVHAHLMAALAVWFACAWMTIVALLLAIYDLLAVRRDGRALRRELEQRFGRE